MRRVFIILILIVIAGGVGYFFFLKNKQQTDGAPSAGVTFRDFFPSTTTTTDGPVSNTDSTDEPTNASNDQLSRFQQLTKRPVAGYTIFSTTKTVAVETSQKTKPQLQTLTDHVLRYISRQSGFVYESKNGETPIQISNIFIPNIYEGFFVDNNQTAILRFLQSDEKTISTYSVPIPPENPDGTRTQKEGVFLPNNIFEISASPDQKQVAQLTTEKSNALITASDSNNKGRKELLYSPLKEWLIQWPQPKKLFLQTKPTGTVAGFLYSLDTTEKKLRRVLGNIQGLTTSVSPDGVYILFSESTPNGIQTSLFNTKNGNVQKIGAAILPEKCVWLKNNDIICAGNALVPQGTYPDAWYAGLVSFSDQLYRIYTANNVFDVIYDNTGESFDMTQLKINEEKGLLYFINKKDGLLWEFTL